MILNGLKPERVLYYFEQLSMIPRESGNEKAVSDYLVSVANELGLEVIQEPCMNVIIKKPATAGYESAPKVILQGHMDMVCTKKEGSAHNFETDPIELVVDGDYIRTKDTTLGADNGIAVAMTLAVLEDKTIEHPQITALVTAAEETGMDGAIGLDPSHVEGDILINLDSEEEGVLLASNAGGANVDITVPVKWISHELPGAYAITIKGLKGGHSGIEINKMRANAIKLIGRLLEHIDLEKLAVFGVSGGEKMNAIAKFATVRVVTDADVDTVMAALEPIEEMFKNEYAVADPDLSIAFERIDLPNMIWSDETLHGVITAMRLIPQGVETMSQSIEGLVESSNNIGVLTSSDKEIVFVNAVRSSVASLKEEIISRMSIIANLIESDVKVYAEYPEWAYRLESPIRDLMIEVYKEMNGKEMLVHAIHAGLECGLLSEKLGDIDMISLGPEMHDVHTPNEHLSISSTERVYTFLLEVLKRIK
ncbi:MULTISPECIES: aminoacyl-histidine dipeptidase [unclassified Fusibacter]|uniref:aminoacyl-histidine dipeptidase n=1 Tax=unclassified Fusibacter TaxID=2624464 RepID=UPI00101331EB|nr:MULTISPECIES: aminoacyl-histidine dipeptidase [unclassified Fusibacter]MCK8059975.1 aminoacyl-histidine dipeptidase [Fusibacter sp. A2]NPE22115.1 aminoacyl-histidine dipeptidase [Fusibacter sp. A1]RXV60893.1 aminoacyl-histidine dipeptidase [Fusibacter sp. A1]